MVISKIHRGKILLCLVDVVIILTSLNMAYLIRLKKSVFHIDLDQRIYFILLVAFSYIISFYIFDFYNLKRKYSIFHLIYMLFGASVLVTLIVMALFYMFPFKLGRGIFFISLISTNLLIFIWRIAFSWLFKVLNLRRNVLAIGTGLPRRTLASIIEEHRQYHLVELSGKDATSLNGEAPFLPKGASLSQIVNDHGVDDIVLCCDSSRDNLLNSQLIDCKLSGIGVYDLPTFYEKLTEKLPVFFIDEKWLYFSNGFDKTSNVIYNKIKRLIDLTISLVLFVLFLPAFGVISLMIKLTSKGPVLFIQDRAGERYQNFKIFKFRTMVLEAEKEGPKWAAEGDPRITALGNILRKTRLDELPQLINVIKGDMSLIGPRPEREYFTEQLKEQIPYYSLRFSVKPGLTGWGQVNFPYGSSLEDAIEKLQYELYYIKNQSLQLDFKIFLKTVRVIMFGMGR